MYSNDDRAAIDGDDDVVIIAPQRELAIAGADLDIMPTIGVTSENLQLLGVCVSVRGINLQLRQAQQVLPTSYWVVPEQASQLTFDTESVLPAAATLMQGQVHILPLIYDASQDKLHIPVVTVTVTVTKPDFISALTLPDDDHAGYDSDRDPGSPPAGCGAGALVWSMEAQGVVSGEGSALVR